jgi:hypothetical protein
VLLEQLLWLLVGAGASLVLAGYRRLDTPPTYRSGDTTDAPRGQTVLWTAVGMAVYGVAVGILLYGVNRGLPLWVAAGFLAVEAVGFLAARRA